MGRKLLASTTSVEPRPGSVVPDEKAASVRKAVYKDVVFPGSDDLIVDHDRCCESHARIENIRAHVVVPQLVGKIVGIVSMQAHGAFRILGFSPNDRVGTSVGRHNGVSAPVQECRYRPRRRSRGQYATRESVLPQVSVRGSQIDASVPVGGIAIETLPTRIVGACGALSGLASFVADKELLRDLMKRFNRFENVLNVHNVGSLQRMWSFKTGGEVYCSPAVANGVVYVGSYDGNVYALKASTGGKLWSHNVGNWVYSSPAVANGVVYVGVVDG